MNKFLNSIQRIVGGVFVLMLILNAGYDFSRWSRKRSVENVVTRQLTQMETLSGGKVSAKLYNCYPITGLGWVCDIEVSAEGQGGHLRGSKFFSNQELSGN